MRNVLFAYCVYCVVVYGSFMFFFRLLFCYLVMNKVSQWEIVAELQVKPYCDIIETAVFWSFIKTVHLCNGLPHTTGTRVAEQPSNNYQQILMPIPALALTGYVEHLANIWGS